MMPVELPKPDEDQEASNWTLINPAGVSNNRSNSFWLVDDDPKGPDT
jgi:hypothetical protein